MLTTETAASLVAGRRKPQQGAGTVKVEITRRCSVAGVSCAVGDIVDVTDQDYRTLISIKKAVPYTGKAPAPKPAPEPEPAAGDEWPDESWTKRQITGWLNDRDIHPPINVNKATLLEAVAEVMVESDAD